MTSDCNSPGGRQRVASGIIITSILFTAVLGIAVPDFKVNKCKV